VPRSRTIMAYAIKAKVVDPQARTFTFTAHKTMYGGKLIAEGDTVFVFASETRGRKAANGTPRAQASHRLE
jgi:hypothetical protein